MNPKEKKVTGRRTENVEETLNEYCGRTTADTKHAEENAAPLTDEEELEQELEKAQGTD